MEIIWSADAIFSSGRQHCGRRYTRVAHGLHAVVDPVHVQKHFDGNCDLSSVPAAPSAAGKSGKVLCRTPDCHDRSLTLVVAPAEKSDACNRPMKVPNNEGARLALTAEGLEERRAAKRNAERSPVPRTQRRRCA